MSEKKQRVNVFESGSTIDKLAVLNQRISKFYVPLEKRIEIASKIRLAVTAPDDSTFNSLVKGCRKIDGIEELLDRLIENYEKDLPKVDPTQTLELVQCTVEPTQVVETSDEDDELE